MLKRKSTDPKSVSLSLELDAEQRAAFQLLSDSLTPNLQCLSPVLQYISKACDDAVPPHKRTLPTHQATEFKRTTEVARVLEIDYKSDDPGYMFELKDKSLQDAGQLSDHFASVLQDIKSSDYVSERTDESFCRTMLDLILIDRLRDLEDKDTFHRLQISAEVPVSIRMKDTDGNDEIIKGRADWALGYGATKGETGAVLLVIEAKPYDSAAIGMPQLLVYMAAIYEARNRKDKVNMGVFGMISDSSVFQFSRLDENKKLFLSRLFIWAKDKPIIISYLDTMLVNAIASSPHTTPRELWNRAIYNYPAQLSKKWQFGEEEDGHGAQDKDNEESEIVDIVKIGGRITMRGVRVYVQDEHDV